MATNILIPNIVVSAAFCNTLYNLNTVAYTLINVDIYMNMDVYILCRSNVRLSRIEARYKIDIQ